MNPDTLKARIEMRITVAQYHLDSVKRSLRDDMAALKDKLHYAVLDIDRGRRNSLVTSNMGFAVAEIVRKRQEIDGHEAHIDALRELLAESEGD